MQRRMFRSAVIAFVTALTITAGMATSAGAASPVGGTVSTPGTYTVFAVDAAGHLSELAAGVSASKLALYPDLGKTVIAVEATAASPQRGSATALAATTTYIYQCYVGTTVRQTTTPQNPRDCAGDYWVLTSSYQAIWHNLPQPSTSALWTAIHNGYAAANSWCTVNSIVCAIFSAAGVAVVGAALAA